MLSGTLFAFFSGAFGLNYESTRYVLSLQTKVTVGNDFPPTPSDACGRPSAFSPKSLFKVTSEFLFYSPFVYIVLIL